MEDAESKGITLEDMIDIPSWLDIVQCVQEAFEAVTMLRDLAVGWSSHDIGKAVTGEDKGHPEAGFSILRDIREISLLSAHVAFQHHETISGQGYPRSIRGNAFHYAQICGECNMYENEIANESPSKNYSL